MTEPNHWHLDKRVPISLIAAIMLQTGVFVWILSEMHQTVEENQRRIIALEAAAQARAELVVSNSTSIAVVNETLRNVESALGRIEKKIDENHRP